MQRQTGMRMEKTSGANFSFDLLDGIGSICAADVAERQIAERGSCWKAELVRLKRQQGGAQLSVIIRLYPKGRQDTGRTYKIVSKSSAHASALTAMRAKTSSGRSTRRRRSDLRAATKSINHLKQPDGFVKKFHGLFFHIRKKPFCRGNARRQNQTTSRSIGQTGGWFGFAFAGKAASGGRNTRRSVIAPFRCCSHDRRDDGTLGESSIQSPSQIKMTEKTTGGGRG